jgi:hypothetical protein
MNWDGYDFYFRTGTGGSSSKVKSSPNNGTNQCWPVIAFFNNCPVGYQKWVITVSYA